MTRAQSLAMIATPLPQKMTPEEYLQWESVQELRYEYCNKAGDTVSIASMGIDLLIEQLYRNVRLAPSPS